MSRNTAPPYRCLRAADARPADGHGAPFGGAVGGAAPASFPISEKGGAARVFLRGAGAMLIEYGYSPMAIAEITFSGRPY